MEFASFHIRADRTYRFAIYVVLRDMTHFLKRVYGFKSTLITYKRKKLSTWFVFWLKLLKAAELLDNLRGS
jgi:hypothetical protein